jgi:hypothetical protein
MEEGRRVSILNLGDWIPQKDVIKLITKHFNDVDWEMIFCAHNSKRYLRTWTFDMCARYGYLNLMQYIKNNTPFGCDTDKACYNATECGHLDILKWVLKTTNGIGCYYDLCNIAALYGHLDVVKWLYKKGCEVDLKTFEDLVIDGNTEIVGWLITKTVRIPRHKDLVLAYTNDNLEMFKCLLKSRYNIPYTESVLSIAKEKWPELINNL